MENQELIKQVTEKAEKWLTPAYDAETQAEVKRMLENEDKTELIEAFYAVETYDMIFRYSFAPSTDLKQPDTLVFTLMLRMSLSA